MENKKRNIGLDILRILSMLGIIGLHLIGQGGILKNLSLYDYRSFIVLLIYTICYLSVDIFGILSGYLCFRKKTIKYSRIVELIFVTFFYSVVITLIFYIFNLYNFKAYINKELINSLFPAVIGRNWYITSYIFVFFLMPYLNFIVEKFEKKFMKKMLIVIFIMLSIIPNVFFQIDFFKVNGGYSPFWLLYCYLIGAYLGKYGISEKKYENRKKYIIVCIVLAFIFNLLVRIVSQKIYGYILYESWFINYTSPFNVIASVLLVSCFADIKFKKIKTNKLIEFFSASSFAVYIIHAHYLIYDYFLKDILKFSVSHNIVFIVVYFIFYSILIYIICSVIEYLRVLLYRFLKIDNVINKIGEKIGVLLNEDGSVERI